MCNVALLDSVSMCMCPCVFACACTYTHSHVCVRMCACTSLFVCLCRSIKFCSHSCRLASAWLWSVCLPLNLQPLLLFDSLSYFLLRFSSASLCCSSLQQLLCCFLCNIILPLSWCPMHRSLWTIPTLFFSQPLLKYCNTLCCFFFLKFCLLHEKN